MKKIVALFLCLAFFTMIPCASLAESTPLVYEVKDESGHTLYLLGTIHVGGEDMYPLSEAVWKAYEASDVLAVEVDVVEETGSLLSSLMTLADLMYGFTDSAKNHLSPETYALGVEMLGVPELLLKRLRPAAWFSLAENTVYQAVGLDATLGADYYLLNCAHHDGKRIDELESMDEQMNMLLNLPEEVLDAEIFLMLTNPEDAAVELLFLYFAWCAGDEETLTEYLAVEDEMDAAYDEFNDVLLGSRNEGFEAQAVAYLQSGETVLIAIGAAHILGEDGLAARLARAGYQVTEIGR